MKILYILYKIIMSYLMNVTIIAFIDFEPNESNISYIIRDNTAGVLIQRSFQTPIVPGIPDYNIKPNIRKIMMFDFNTFKPELCVVNRYYPAFSFINMPFYDVSYVQNKSQKLGIFDEDTGFEDYYDEHLEEYSDISTLDVLIHRFYYTILEQTNPGKSGSQNHRLSRISLY